MIRINQKAGSQTAVAVHLDVTRAADWRAAVESCQREFGGLDVLVNNAGVLNVKPSVTVRCGLTAMRSVRRGVVRSTSTIRPCKNIRVTRGKVRPS
jgi:NAD(P)-dependent dehydrogenase (short-subunit alcohol dehydrogenase family)